MNATELYRCAYGEARWLANGTNFNEVYEGQKTPKPGDFNYTDFYDNVVKESNTSAKSFAAFDAAQKAVRAELALLFDENGKPTAYNSYDKQAEVDKLVADFNAAYNSLDRLLKGTGLLSFAYAYDNIDILNMFIEASGIKEADYTPESWANFTAARKAALKFVAENERVSEESKLGVNQVEDYITFSKALQKAYYQELTSSKATVNAKLYITDNCPVDYGFDGVEQSELCGIYELSLPADNTLEDAIKDIFSEHNLTWKNNTSLSGLHHDITFENKYQHILVYVNGLFYYDVTKDCSLRYAFNDTLLSEFNKIRVKDGDEIVLAIVDYPVDPNSSGVGTTDKPFYEVYQDIAYIEMTKDGKAVSEFSAKAGEKLSMDIVSYAASPFVYSGKKAALKNAKLYISECCASREEAMKAKLVREADFSSGDDGSYELRLYSGVGGPGWYLLGAVSTSAGKDWSLANGPTVLVHVEDPDDLDPIRESFIAKLDAVYTAYEDLFYTDEQLADIKGWYEACCAAIDAAGTSGAMEKAYLETSKKISAVQDKNNADAENLKSSVVQRTDSYVPLRSTSEKCGGTPIS